MCAVFSQADFPDAVTIIEEAMTSGDSDDSLYMKYYSALNNISRIAYKRAKGKFPNDREGVEAVSDYLDDNSMTTFIGSAHFGFFAMRTCFDCPEFDATGLRNNGVLDLRALEETGRLIYESINSDRYNDYAQHGDRSAPLLSELTKDALGVIYMVRNNLSHGRKNRHNPDNDHVIENALPLLRMILGFLIEV